MKSLDEELETIVNSICDTNIKLAPQTDPSSLTFESLGVDSLDLVELAMSVEETFGVEISDEDWEKMTSVTDILYHIKVVTRRKNPQGILDWGNAQ